MRKIISNVLKPFTYICNLSFVSGMFPEKLKIAKVIPLFKAGEKKSLLITGLFPYYHSFLKFSKNCSVKD